MTRSTLAARVGETVTARVPAGRRLTADTNFFEAGLTSARLAEAVAELQANGIEIALLDMFRYPTLNELCDALAARSGLTRPGPADRLPWEM